MSVFDRFRLDGRRALVTGGSRGLGREMALALAEAGADVVVVGRSLESLQEIVSRIQALGRYSAALAADLESPEACERMCAEATAQHGPIDILINNVGGRRVDVSFEAMPLSEWRRLIDLNLTSAAVCTKMLGSPMVQRHWGRIINICSINSFVIGRGIGGRTYETSKGGLLQLTRAVAADWAPYGVTVNAICPGGFMTDANKRWLQERPEVVERFRAQIPMGDYGDPVDLGPLAVYLASDASRYMTGAALVIDGGYTLW